jgi:hypothetical protein
MQDSTDETPACRYKCSKEWALLASTSWIVSDSVNNACANTLPACFLNSDPILSAQHVHSSVFFCARPAEAGLDFVWQGRGALPLFDSV